MGFAKRRLEEFSFRGFGDTGDQAVCLDCVTDEGLVKEIKSRLTEDQCSFCGKMATGDGELVAANFEDFMEVVMSGVHFIYNRANEEGVAFDEGNWVGAPIFDSDDVIENVCGCGVSDDVLEAIKAVVDWDDWTYRNFLRLQPDRAMRLGWAEFCRKVKHEARFVFLSIPQPSSFDPDQFTPAEFLRNLTRIISSAGVLTEVPAGRVFWRGRLVSGPTLEDKYRSNPAKELGSTPPDRASANRMSPAGISMFYGSDDVETVVAEIGAHNTRGYAVLGAFETTKPLNLLNLADVPAVPSIFDGERRSSYYDLRFLHDFAEDLRKPVVLDGRLHIEYVPTQVVTEYLRWMPEEDIDGILFQSAQNDGLNCVIFCDASGCAERGDETAETYLRFMPDSARVVRVVASFEEVEGGSDR